MCSVACFDKSPLSAQLLPTLLARHLLCAFSGGFTCGHAPFFCRCFTAFLNQAFLSFFDTASRGSLCRFLACNLQTFLHCGFPTCLIVPVTAAFPPSVPTLNAASTAPTTIPA